MIGILCNSPEEARDAFLNFVMLLEDAEPWTIKNVYDSCNCVEVDEDLRYLFIDYRFGNVLLGLDADLVDEDEFFEGIY